MGTQVRFWMDSYKNELKSKEAGVPVFDTVPWCEVRVIGEPDTITGPVHRLQPDPRQRFPEAWAAWQRDNSTEGIVGTPLSEVPWLARGEVETLRYAGIRTLENLASIADGSLGNIPGAIALRQKAKDMLRAAQQQAPLQAMSDDLAKMREENKQLRAQMQDIIAAKKSRQKEC